MKAYDIRDGNQLWETELGNSGNAMYSYSYGDHIFLSTNNGKFYTFDLGGQIVSETDPYQYFFPVYFDHYELVMNPVNIEVKDSQTKKRLWLKELDYSVVPLPIIIDDAIYFRTQFWPGTGRVIAINNSNGELNWVSPKDVMSNFGVIDSRLFYLSEDGYLVFLNRNTGQELERLEFSPKPISDLGGYFVTADPQNKIIVVSFGDRSQVMAIQLK